MISEAFLKKSRIPSGATHTSKREYAHMSTYSCLHTCIKLLWLLWRTPVFETIPMGLPILISSFLKWHGLCKFYAMLWHCSTSNEINMESHTTRLSERSHTTFTNDTMHPNMPAAMMLIQGSGGGKSAALQTVGSITRRTTLIIESTLFFWRPTFKDRSSKHWLWCNQSLPIRFNPNETEPGQGFEFVTLTSKKHRCNNVCVSSPWITVVRSMEDDDAMSHA